MFTVISGGSDTEKVHVWLDEGERQSTRLGGTFLRCTLKRAAVVVALFGWVHAAQAAVTYRDWAAADGFLNEAANWKDGVVPAGGEAARFSGDADYYVRIPAGGYTETAGVFTYAICIGYGHSLTFDATGTSWLKPAGTQVSNWQAFMLATYSPRGNASNSHMLNATELKNTSPVMELSGGKLKLTSATGGSTLELLPGATLNFWNPGGVTVDAAHKIALHDADYAGANNKIIFRDGSKLIANGVNVDGGPANSLVLFEGGDHAVKQDLVLGVNGAPYGANPASPYVHVAGGSLTVGKSTVVGGRSNSVARLLIDGTGTCVTVESEFNLGNTQNATGLVDVVDSGALTVVGDVTFGRTAAGVGGLTVAGRGRVTAKKGLYVGRSAGSVAAITVRDDGVLSLTGTDAFFLSGTGASAAREVRFTLESGTLDATNHYLGISGTNVTVAFGGGVSTLRDWRIFGDACTFATNRITVSGGTHTAESILLGNSGSSTALEISGGAVTASGRMSVGAPSGTHAFRMTGGELAVNGPDGMTLSPSAAVALDGGRLAAQCVTGDVNARVSANGGTLVALAQTAAKPFIGGMTAFSLGAKGLTVDVGNLSAVTLNQAFTDAEAGTTGLFTKTGNGTLILAASSTHGATVLAAGTTVSTLTAFQFGRAVAITNGAALDLTGTATSFTCGQLTLGGSDGSFGILKLDAADTVTVTEADGLAVHAGGLVFGAAGTAGTYVVFSCAGTVSSADLSKLAVLNPAAGFSYAFASVANGDGADVTLTVAAVSPTDVVWNGAAGTAWGEAGNWASTVPTAATRALFPADAATKSVAVADNASVAGLSFAGDYALTGGSLAFIGGLTGSAGSTTIATPLTTAGAVSFDIASGAAVALNSTLSAVYADFTKNGSGRLVLAGGNDNLAGSWKLAGGVLDAAHPDALGHDNDVGPTVTLASGTLRYSGATPATIGHVLKIATGSDQGRAVVAADGDVTFAKDANSTGGGLVKTGAGTMTVVFGDGAYNLGTGNLNAGDPEVMSLPADGSSSPAAAGQSAGLDVLDGKLVLKGRGAARTTINQTQSTWIGTAWTGIVTQAALAIDGITFNQGGASRPLTIGSSIGNGKPNAPSLTVDNSIMACNTIALGKGSTEMYPLLAVTNSTITLIYELTLGTDNVAVHPILRLGTGATVKVDRGSGSSTGVVLKKNVDGLVSDGAVLAARPSGNIANSGVQFANGATGQMKFTSDGTLSTYKFQTKNFLASDTEHVDLVFDGGKLQMTASGTTVFAKPAYQGFTTEGAGLELEVGTGVTHAFTCPFRGAGKVVKTGAGRLVFAPGLELTANVGETNVSGLVTGNHTGGTVVQEGVFQIGAGVLRDGAAVDVEAGAVLDLGGNPSAAVTVGALSGAGTVTNGVLAGALNVSVVSDLFSTNDLLRLGDGVTVHDAGFKVKFDVADGLDVNRLEIPVCRRIGTAVLNCALWRSEGLPDGLMAVFTLRDDVVMATVQSTSRMIVIIR